VLGALVHRAFGVAENDAEAWRVHVQL
jgi:hypothetical protein